MLNKAWAGAGDSESGKSFRATKIQCAYLLK